MKLVYMSTSTRTSLLRAILALALGVVLIIWPGTAIRYIIMLIGVIFLIIGVISLVLSYKQQGERTGNLISFSGAGSLLLGLLLVCAPSWFATIFMIMLGFILVIAAIGQFVTLAAARQFGNVSWMSYIFPVLILISGIVVLFDPFKSAESVFILFGVTSIFYGITDLINQYTIKKMRKDGDEKEKIERMGASHDIEDAEYEEIKE